MRNQPVTLTLSVRDEWIVYDHDSDVLIGFWPLEDASAETAQEQRLNELGYHDAHVQLLDWLVNQQIAGEDAANRRLSYCN